MKYKKIGIITFHAAKNCGSMLQSYALQKTLSDKYNIENEIINFSNKKQQDMYSVLFVPKSIKKVLRLFLSLIFYRLLSGQARDYISFSHKFLKKSKDFYENTGELAVTEDLYDAFITGSDQVWNTRCADCDKAYYLSFVKNKPKYAYAVSMGATNINDFDSDEKNIYADLIKKFDRISVREKNAQLWIEQLTGLKTDIMPDPTLLLIREEWDSITPERIIKEKYVFWYAMNYTKKERKAVTAFAKKMNLPVYILDGKEWTRRGLFFKNIKVCKAGGPLAYLSLMKNAEYVITSSFHGAVFATIFQKRFVYMKTASGNKNDDRASFIMSQLGMDDRLVTIDDVNSVNISFDIDYNNAEKNIKILQDNAEDFLDNILM